MVGALFALWSVVSAQAWVLPDTKAIADAAARLNMPGSFQSALDAFATPGGHVWLVARDFCYKYVDGTLDYSLHRRKLTYRLVDSRGVQVGRDIVISLPGNPGISNSAPVASLYDGSLVVTCVAEGGVRLARIDTEGVLVVSDSFPQFDLGSNGFIDRHGLIHIAGGNRGVDYMQVNTIPRCMPTVRQLKYADRFGTADSAPFWMRWKGSSDGEAGLIAGCDEDSGRLVVAAHAVSDSFIRLCRFDTKTLRVMDSGLIYLDHDVHHLIQDSTIWSLTLVHSDSGGFWLFIPGDVLWPYHPMMVRAYRLSHDLTPLRPTVVGRDSVRPFGQAPEGSLLAYRLIEHLPKERYSKSGYSRSGTFGLHFTACGSDGRLYETHEERPVSLEVFRSDSSDSLGGR
jgi:hypothetical protein